jgi:hypothetical protein
LRKVRSGPGWRRCGVLHRIRVKAPTNTASFRGALSVWAGGCMCFCLCMCMCMCMCLCMCMCMRMCVCILGYVCCVLYVYMYVRVCVHACDVA